MIYPPEFDRLWRHYPRKRNKADAFKAWQQTEKERPAEPELLRALLQMTFSDDWNEHGGKFIPYLGSWLRSHGWEDEPTRIPDQMEPYERQQMARALEDEIDGLDAKARGPRKIQQEG